MSTATPAVPAAAAVPAVPLVDPVLTAEEEYDAAFLDSIADPSIADEIPAVPAVPAPAAATPPVTAATSSAVETVAPVVPAAEPVAADPAAVVETPVEPAATSDAVAEQLRLLREELTPEPVAAVEPPPAAKKPAYTAEELAAISAYEKDWPDIAAAEQLKRRAEYQDLLAYAFSEVARVYGPVIQSMQETESNGHYNEIVTAHPDYDKIVEPVKAWVGEQSPARRAAFSTIVKEGTSEEIIDLIDLYKTAKGIAAPVAAVPAPTVAAPAVAVAAVPAVGTPPAAKQAAQRLSVVSSKRSATPVAADMNDYDAAFDEFVKAGAK